MGYWKAVSKRAWAEAVRASSWSTPVRLVGALAGVAFTAVAVWLSTRQVPITAVAGVAGSGLVVLGFALSGFVTVPPAMAREAVAREAALQATVDSYQPQEPDENIECAIGHILTGRWAPTAMTDLEAIRPVFADIRQRAFYSKIRVWGRRTPGGLDHAIPASFWEHCGLSEYGRDANDRLTTDKGGPGTGSHRYHDLRIVRTQIEREWPLRPAG